MGGSDPRSVLIRSSMQLVVGSTVNLEIPEQNRESTQVLEGSAFVLRKTGERVDLFKTMLHSF